MCSLFGSCKQEKPLFVKLGAAHTGIDFRNELKEDDQHNILNFTNLYTGSGVGVGDFNDDGLPDLFFGGNQESSRMYINKGGLQFEDVTLTYGLSTDRWVTGVAIADINADGWDDIYLSVSGMDTVEKQKNLLFINQQGQAFKEQAEEYGLADAAQCTHANFFDYDKDGDLDLFLIVNPTDYTLYNVNNIRRKKTQGEAASTDKLYRNNRISPAGTNDTLPPFSDVSRQAGILIEGYSLSLNISDINNDNWPDIYITNDFLSNDLLYINNQDGTFTDRAAEYFRHTSFASMGVDIADINNDGLPDIYVLDMYPEDNYRQKMILGSDNYDRFQYMLQAGYQAQYSRNTLQINNGDGSFSEIGQLANVHKTDWSWSALLADYDNDGFRDLFVTNGFRRDLGDLDYINYNNTDPFGDPEARRKAQLERILAQPGALLSNYVFKNENGLQFTKKSAEWGVDEPSYSHGAAYADLDIDGDLDLIVNNVSQEVFIYENQATFLNKHHYLNIELDAESKIGTKVWLYYGKQLQYAEYTPYRGYLSSLSDMLHFGLGDVTTIDSLRIQWPNGRSKTYYQLAVDKMISFAESDAKAGSRTPIVQGNLYFKAADQHIEFFHKEDLQVDFKTQPLLPHQHSRIGPCMATADLNDDGLDDFFVGGAAGYPGQIFVQGSKGDFIQNALAFDEENEDAAAVFFDADQDGDKDLYVVSGGVVFSQHPNIYQDRLYLNEAGTFKKAINLPVISSSGGCVAAEDFDQDGDIDLFVGGRVSPGHYPSLPSSHLLENRDGKFVDITPLALKQLGMVSSCSWVDIDQDSYADLVLAGEFMPITIFPNSKGKLAKESRIITHSSGWWNCLRAGDFDADGDIDFLAGNLGLNSNHRASKVEPLCLYANDFDQNGSVDPVICQYIDGTEYPAASRDKLIQQIPPIKTRFDSYKKYALATFEDIFKKPEEEGMQILQVQQLASCYIENIAGSSFLVHLLPLELQLAPINDFLLDDFDSDGHLDALAVGNSYTTEVSIGNYDAFKGAFLRGRGDGSFEIYPGNKSGFLADKDARSVIQLQASSDKRLIIVGNNSDYLQSFEINKSIDK